VNGDDSQRNEAGSSPWADDSATDVVEQGGRRFFPSLNWSPRWRPPRGAVVLLAVGLVIGLAAGYAAGYRQAPRNASAPTASPSPTTPPPAPAQTVIKGTAILPLEGTVTQATGTCSVQSGRELQLGVQVTNGSAEPVTLGQIHTVFPLGGLRVISQRWAPCGLIGAVEGPAILGPGDSTWFSVTVRVLVGCPAPLPVEFTVDYSWAEGHAAVNLAGFPDLGQVPYAGCAGG
jgi:hypothetical protein